MRRINSTFLSRFNSKGCASYIRLDFEILEVVKTIVLFVHKIYYSSVRILIEMIRFEIHDLPLCFVNVVIIDFVVCFYFKHCFVLIVVFPYGVKQISFSMHLCYVAS